MTFRAERPDGVANRLAAKASYIRRRWGGEKQVEFSCAGCGQVVRPTYGDKRRTWCSRDCYPPRGRSRREIQAERRTRKLRARLVERDGLVCGPCGLPIDITLRSPHPLSMTVDHIHPVSAGGSGDMDNLWLAHRRCNEEKGDEIGWSRSGLFSSVG